MKNRYLQIVFDQPIQSFEIPYFRAAVIEKSRRESDLFHNHLEGDRVIYRYPLIQYKVKERKPCLICLNEATEDIHYLLKQKDFHFRIGKETRQYEIGDVRLQYVPIKTGAQNLDYNIHHWMALNQEYFQSYKQLTSYVEKVQMLETILEKHLRIFLDAMHCTEEEPFKVSITNIKSEKYIEYKGVFQLTFSLNFSTNLQIPDLVGIGKGVSVGFGMVKSLKPKGHRYEE